MRKSNAFFEPLESREPEKTPLIDMVFLLLVFFFVNLSVAPVSRKTAVHASLQEDAKRSFLKVPKPASYDEQEVVLVEILDANVVSTRNRLLSVKSRIDQCAHSVNCGALNVPPIGTGVGAVRFWVSLIPLDRLEQEISSWGSICPSCDDIRAAEQDFPIPWSDGMVEVLRNKLQVFGASGAEEKKIHIRVPAAFPAGKFLSCFYELVQTTPGLNRDQIFIRALEEKI